LFRSCVAVLRSGRPRLRTAHPHRRERELGAVHAGTGVLATPPRRALSARWPSKTRLLTAIKHAAGVLSDLRAMHEQSRQAARPATERPPREDWQPGRASGAGAGTGPHQLRRHKAGQAVVVQIDLLQR